MTTTDRLTNSPIFYTSPLLRDFSQKNVKHNTNERYNNFNQLYFTAGDVEQFEQYRQSNDGKKPRFNRQNAEDKFHAQIDLEVHRVYNGKLSKPVITDTFNYIFNKFKKGIYVKIRGGKIETFLPFSNAFFVNEYSEKFGHISKCINVLKQASSHTKYKFSPKKINFNTQAWYANNSLVRCEFPLAENDTNVAAIRDFLDVLTNERSVPDCDFFINKRDFPILAEGQYEPYYHIFDSKKHPLKSHRYDRYAPIFSFSVSNRDSDILMPCVDDWIRVASKENRFFCRSSNDYILKSNSIDWEKKREIAVWRGSSTGAGVDFETNQRLKISKMCQDLMMSGDDVILDAGITSWKTRARKISGKQGLQTIDIEKLNIPLVNKIPFHDFSKYKYVVNIAGHTSAYRLGAEFSLKSVVLIVESDYQLWFQRFLKDGVHYVSVASDLSNIEDKIKWLIQNDDKAKKIAQNGYKFYTEKLCKEGMLDFMQNTIIKLCRKMPLDEWVDSTHSVPKIDTHIPNIKIESTLAESAKSCVNLAYHNGKYVVAKKVYNGKIGREFAIGKKIVNSMPNKKRAQSFMKTFYANNDTLVLEYVPGMSLLHWIQSDNFSVANLCSILRVVCKNIDHAQTWCGFVHGDLCPTNIILRNNDHSDPCIIDYGNSRGVTEFGQVIWTLPYLQQFSQYQDMWHLGITTLYHISRRRDSIQHSRFIEKMAELFFKTQMTLKQIVKITKVEAKFSRLLQRGVRGNVAPADFIEHLDALVPRRSRTISLTDVWIVDNLSTSITTAYKSMATFLLRFWNGIPNSKVDKKVNKLYHMVLDRLKPLNEWDLDWMCRGLNLAYRYKNGEKSGFETIVRDYKKMVDFEIPEKLSMQDLRFLVTSIDPKKIGLVKKYSTLLEFKKSFA